MPVRVASLMLARHAELIGSRDERSTSPLFIANQWLVQTSNDLTRAHIKHAFDESAIRDHAANYARICSRMRTLIARVRFAADLGIDPPQAIEHGAGGPYCSLAGITARFDDARWWRRQLRTSWTRAAENAMRDIGTIRRGAEPYASDEAVAFRAIQKQRTRNFVESSSAVCIDTGEELPLEVVVDASVSNPALRRGEFMCRARGFECIARDLRHVAQFFTLTCPSRYHAQLASAGMNPNFARENVRAAQQWLCKTWARARAALKRRKVLMYGLRVCEPHHDATPHWHILAFAPARDVETLRTIIKRYWLKDSGTEPGAAEHRVRIETIDESKGSATGYLSKYISKNIDGAGQMKTAEDYETGASGSQSIARVEAWACLHGLRQFAQLGGPPVGLWRECRRLRERVADVDIERARIAADRGDWRAFIYAAHPDHIKAGRRCSLKLIKTETGETGRYGELRPARVVGVSYASALEITRPHLWRIQPNTRERPPASCESSSDEATGHGRGADGTCGITPCSERPPVPGSSPARRARRFEADTARGSCRASSFSSSAREARFRPWTRGNICTARVKANNSS